MRHGRAFWLFVGPFAIGLLVFVYVPIAWSLLLSFFEARGIPVVATSYWLGAVFNGTSTNGVVTGTDITQSTGGNIAPSSNPGSVPGRWADPDSGSGVSGEANLPLGTPTRGVINQNKIPVGGPPTCPWTTNNCGPNDEPFSLHVGGCHALLGDGSVRFVSENTETQVIRRACSRASLLPSM